MCSMLVRIKKYNIVLLVIFIVFLLFVFGNILRSLTSASGIPWVQTDWSSGVGSSTTNQYSSSTGLVTSTLNQLTLTSSEKASNLGFESNMSGWNSGDTPDQISGLRMWLKADAITGKNDNDTISTWDDSSGNSNSVTAAV